jgi:hypothetical protein
MDHVYTQKPFWLPLLLVFVVFVVISVELKIVERKLRKDKDASYDTPIYNSLRNLLSIWRKILPENINKLFENYDTVRPTGGPHPRLMLILYLLIDLMILLIVVRYVFYFFHKEFEHDALYVLIEHIDVAGLINGLLGIGLAIIIALVVYDQDKNERSPLIESTIAIKESTANIDDITKNLQDNVKYSLNNLTALKPINTFDERLNAFEEILSKAEKDNDLYIMNYSADFGFLRTNNLRILLDDINFESDSQKNVLDALYNSHQKFGDKIVSLKSKLLRLCDTKRSKARIAFLDNSSVNILRKSHYERYIERALDYSTIVSWAKIKERDPKTINELYNVLPENVNANDEVVYIDFNTDEKNDDAVKSEFIKELIIVNERNIKEFKNLPHFGVKAVDRVPFQFMMTKPSSGKSDISNQSCLIIFSNIDAIGENAGVFAFQSGDERVIENLRLIYVTYEKQQSERNVSQERQRWIKFNDFFELERDKAVYTVLKCKALEEKKPEMIFGVSLSDIEASIKINSLFQSMEEKLPIAKYHTKDFVQEKASDDFSNFTFEKAVYFSVGLFGEHNYPLTLSEYIGNHFSNNHVKFVRRESINDKNKIIINGEEFQGIWETDNSVDMGVITKTSTTIKGNAVTVFIIGGINHYGTEKLSEGLYNFWEVLYDYVGDKNFTALYSIDREEVLLKKLFVAGKDILQS